jgi:alkyldihydroxyacetonephosphate synthase
VEAALPAGAVRFLADRVGPATPPRDAVLADVLATVPPSRLPPRDGVATDAETRVRYAAGQSFPDWVALRSGRPGALPDGVAFPESGEEVRALFDFARRAGAVLVPRGGGTSVAGHVSPAAGERPVLVVSLERMNRLLALDETSRLATFGAGVAGPDLEAALRARGWTLGHFPQSWEWSTLGGWVATRSSGQQSLRYGRIEALFAGGRMETPAGPVVLPPHPASAAGPDVREMVLGSEGRMGILTEVTVRISPAPAREAFHAVFLPSWDAGRAATREIAGARLPLSLVRLSGAAETETNLALAGHERMVGLLERYLSLRGAGAGRCMLLLGVTGDDAAVRGGRRESLRIVRRHGGVHVGTGLGERWRRNRFRSAYLRNTLWEMGYAVDTLETAVPWGAVPALVDDVEASLRGALADAGERVHAFTHLSHVYPTGSSAYTTFVFRLAPDADETLRRWRELKRRASEAVVRHGGTISHQHGVGRDHRPYLAAEKGPLGMRATEELCRVFDPEALLNPGVLVD